MKKIFTTGEAAKICGVAPRTVTKWMDAGYLKGYRLPGGQDRRFLRASLEKFLRENGMPLDALGREGWHKILLVGCDRALVARLAELLPEGGDVRYDVAESCFEAGMLSESFRPDTAVIDLGLGRSDALAMARSLRLAHHPGMLIIGISGEDEAAPVALAAAGFVDVFKRPFDPALLAKRLKREVENGRDR